MKRVGERTEKAVPADDEDVVGCDVRHGCLWSPSLGPVDRATSNVRVNVRLD